MTVETFPRTLYKYGCCGEVQERNAENGVHKPTTRYPFKTAALMASFLPSTSNKITLINRNKSSAAEMSDRLATIDMT